MNVSKMRELRDVTVHGENYEFTITVKTREKIRKAARISIVGAGVVSTAMGAVLLIGSLIAEGTAIPILVCAAITGYAARLVIRR